MTLSFFGFFDIYKEHCCFFFSSPAIINHHQFCFSQTIYGKLISLESNSDALGLAVFILQRLLWNPDIAAEYRHAKVPHLYKDGNFRGLFFLL